MSERSHRDPHVCLRGCGEAEPYRNLASMYGRGINMDLDFTATPKTEIAALTPWIIVDFSLKTLLNMPSKFVKVL
ncbi:MAG: hypothetical protein WBI96_04655 [Candidatus Hydrothermia bacterium]